MTGEYNTYGFIANTIATNAKDESSDVGNDALVVPWKNILDLNTNRTILKVINTNKQEPIKAKAKRNEDDKLKIEVTYSANDIEKILDENGNILSENSTTAVTVPNLKGEGIYKYIIIDNAGNLKEVKIKVENVFRYQIPDLETLELFRDTVNAGNTYAGKTVEVVADIDMSSKYGEKDINGNGTIEDDEKISWIPIGVLSDTFFSGIFEGNHYTISGIYINSDINYQGLFGMVKDAEVKNIILGEGTIKAKDYVGGISGWAKDSTIYGCINNINITTAEQKGRYTGGILGATSTGNIIVEKCANNGNISGSMSVAGILGNLSGTVYINECCNKGDVNCTGDNPSGYYQWYAGGIAGWANGGSSVNIDNCYNIGQICSKGTSYSMIYSGGILGDSRYKITINNCYSKGILKNARYIGGITYNQATMTNCYYLTGCGATTGGTSVAENTLKGYANRVDGFSVLGDAFMKDEWNINNGYPILIWEVPDWQFTEKNTCIAVGETIDIDVIDIGKNMLHKNQGGFTWGSSDTDIATVDSNGIVTGVSAGEVTISATNGDITIPLETKIRVVDVKLANTATTTYIYTANDLVDFKNSVNVYRNSYSGKTVQLMSDIDLSTICGQKIGSWEPIGATETNFAGTFDGMDYTVSNIYINNDLDNQGFFRFNNGTIKKLKIDGNIKCNTVAGGIVAQNVKTIMNCDSKVNINVSNMAGGICGSATYSSSTIENCSNKGNIIGTVVGNVGGIAGVSWETVRNCYNTGNIKATQYTAGGIVGYVQRGSIYNCYNTGNIYSAGNSGGIAGATGSSGQTIYLYNCYTLKKVTGSTNVGNIVGLKNANGGTLSSVNCYDTTVTASALNANEYSFNIWIDDEKDSLENWKYNNGYPILKWQLPENI